MYPFLINRIYYCINIHFQLVVNMNLKLSVRDIRFIRPLYTYLSWILITPLYDFDNNKICRSVLLKIYAVSVISLKIIATILLTRHDSFLEKFKTVLFTQLVTSIL